MVRVVDCHAGVLPSNPGRPKYFPLGTTSALLPKSGSPTGVPAQKIGSSVVGHSGARGPSLDPISLRGNFLCLNTFSLMSFAGMTLDKCIILQIWMLTGCPLCRESHPLCRLKKPMVMHQSFVSGPPPPPPPSGGIAGLWCSASTF